jgi:hypothetical protein
MVLLATGLIGSCFHGLLMAFCISCSLEEDVLLETGPAFCFSVSSGTGAGSLRSADPPVSTSSSYLGKCRLVCCTRCEGHAHHCGRHSPFWSSQSAWTISTLSYSSDRNLRRGH